MAVTRRGPKLGYKQTSEHIAKRFANGSPNRKGDMAGVKAGRTRAIRMYPDAPEVCEVCGESKRLDRHHKDGNTLNNHISNIAFLCRKCHMTVDGRIDRMNEVRNASR